MTWSFLVTALVVVLMPGTGVVYTLAVSLGQGLRGASRRPPPRSAFA